MNQYGPACGWAESWLRMTSIWVGFDFAATMRFRAGVWQTSIGFVPFKSCTKVSNRGDEERLHPNSWPKSSSVQWHEYRDGVGKQGNGEPLPRDTFRHC